MKMETHLPWLLAATVSATGIQSAFSQGSLTPPGAPAPTMKTLDQVQPRTPISTVPFSINTAGSYYLTGTIAAGNRGGTIILPTASVAPFNGSTGALGSGTTDPFANLSY